MKIGIDASRAFLKQRTGIEEYAFQVLVHLTKKIDCQHTVVLYVRRGQAKMMHDLHFILPHHWHVQEIHLPRFWTQIGLSREMRKNPVDVLFIPAHTIPIVHPKNSIVTVHGLEYEFCPEAYSWWERVYMRWSIKHSCKWARHIIAVSENTKKDLIELYHVPQEKISVIYEGFLQEMKESGSGEKTIKQEEQSAIIRQWKPYLYYIGRIEQRKNIVRILESFEMLKKGYHIPHKLVLAGKPGYGYSRIEKKIRNSKYREDIIEMGYVSNNEKRTLLENADVFLFPTLYEGFGLPVVEAQAVGVPTVISSTASLPEIAGEGALPVDPYSVDEITEGIYKVISDDVLRNNITEKGKKNTERFGWEECAEKIAKLLVVPTNYE
jgi:glycosyltransferase involved in cell wall biosynthesis